MLVDLLFLTSQEEQFPPFFQILNKFDFVPKLLHKTTPEGSKLLPFLSITLLRTHTILRSINPNELN